jgi:hypothetical protein
MIRSDEMNKYQLLGIEEVEMTCEFCNKQHIGKAYTFRNSETGDVVRYGSTCAKKALGLTASKLDSMKASIKAQITFKYQDLISNANIEDKAALFAEQIKAEKLYR